MKWAILQVTIQSGKSHALRQKSPTPTSFQHLASRTEKTKVLPAELAPKAPT